MTLDFSQITDIIDNNPNKKRIKKAVELHNELNMHVNGVGLDEAIEKISEYENEAQREVRKRLRESNKGLFTTLLHPVNKVYSAKGGARRYNLSEANQKSFKNKLQNVAYNLPINSWIEKKIQNKEITDPNGVIFIEVSDEVATPTFKSITTIYDYSTNGQKVDYIIFNPFQKDNDDSNYFRVVDDVNDYIIKQTSGKDKNSYSIVLDETYPNHFGYVPAMVVSDMFHETEPIQKSFVSNILEKANKFMLDNSVHTVHKLLHGFAKYWEYAQDCFNCNGTGIVKDADGQSIACPVCSGTGNRPNGDVSDKILAPFPTDKDMPVITQFSGFESPSVEIWQQYKDDLKDHKEELEEMLWHVTLNKSTNETATGRFIDTQPKSDQLNSISNNKENIETFITDALGQFYFPYDYKGCSISYGRRYLVESADVIWNKLSKAIKDKMPISLIVDLSKEYIESRYQNNDIESDIQLKILELEPFTFLTINDVKGLNVSDEDLKSKIYFQEWLTTKSQAELLLKTKEVLKSELKTFVSSKKFKEVAQPIIN